MSNLNPPMDASQEQKREWSQPRVQRLAAGSAENGNDTLPDNVTPS